MSAEPTPIKLPVTDGLDYTKDYVAGGAGTEWPSPWTTTLRSLRWAIDDTAQSFGDDIYERMALDPIVSSTLAIFAAAILEDGINLSSPVTDPADPDAALAQEITDAANAMIENLDTPIDIVLWDMLKMVHLGNRVAETIWELIEGSNGLLRLNVRAIKVKPRRSLAFVVDVYGNLLGLQAVIPGRGRQPTPGSNVQDTADLLPRDKFIIMSFRPTEGDPRGSSILRPAFSAWVDKIQTLAERQKHIVRYASPTIFGTTAERAQHVEILDVNKQPTGKWMNPQQAMQEALLSLHSGSVTAAPFGAMIQLIEATGGGEVFANAIQYDDVEIVKTILTQTLATGEGTNGSTRASSRVHQDTLNTLIRHSKKSVVTGIREDFLKVWVIKNWGIDKAHLAPRVALGTTEAPDLSSVMAAVARLFASGFIAKSQLNSVDELLNLPKRLPDEVESTEPVGSKPEGNPGGIGGPDAKPER